MPTAQGFLRRPLAALIALLFVSIAALPALAARPAHVPQRFDRAWQTQQRFQRVLLQRSGVVGVALGENAAGEPVLKLFLERAGITGLPDYVDGEAVETLVTGHFRAGQFAPQAGESPAGRWPRPVPIGVSIGHQDVTAGTLGCQVFQGSGCHVTNYYILSNNHVLANSNAGQIDDLILQPGKVDGGSYPGDVIGKLYDFQPVEISTTANNIMDAAIAYAVPSDVGFATPADGYGAPVGSTVSPVMNLKVRKDGRSTRMTGGRITAINATVMVDYPGGTAQFVQQFIVSGDNSQPFSGAGDSGSLVVVNGGSNDRKAVGLLFAGAGNLTAVNPIGPILARFNVQIAGD